MPIHNSVTSPTPILYLFTFAVAPLPVIMLIQYWS
jgi:hypothetical protein